MNDIDNMNKNCGAAEVFEELTFEQAASKLEEIVEKLDSGETPPVSYTHLTLPTMSCV